ncbi:MAG TPA: hypothetical protein VGB45_03420 [Abditibacterium sp.]|jgi:hypothetical protein
MGFLDSLFGRKEEENQPQQPYGQRGGARPQRPQNADEQALARYRYMLQTAPPEEIEAAHAEAFARLTPEQRQLALQQMSQTMPEAEARELSDDPRRMARAATRAEMRQPGSMERTFGGANQTGGMGMGGGMMGGGMMGGMGGLMAGSLLTSIAGGFIGSSIANSFFNNGANEQAFQGSPEAQAVDGGVSDYNGGDFQETGLDSGADPYGDPGADGGLQDAGLDSSADSLGDPGLDSGGFSDAGFGGDFGGGDFGGEF